jgi:hypothetical protein
LDLLRALQQIPALSEAVLVGGTSAALQMGHRTSVDLDLFGKMETDGLQLLNLLQKERLNTELKYNTKAIKTFFVNDIKVDIVDYSFDWLEPIIVEDGLRLAGLKDISAIKLAAITGRGTKKDFIDLFFLLKKFKLNEMLEFYKTKFKTSEIYIVVRSMSYFVDAENNPAPKMFVEVSWEKVKETIKKEIIKIAC